jgi:hypothetical protein
MLTSSPVHLLGYDVIDPVINFSDHLSILGHFGFVLPTDEQWRRHMGALGARAPPEKLNCRNFEAD